MKIVVLCGLMLAFSVASTASLADASCDILRDGNVPFKTGKYEQAREIYQKVESIDRMGRQECTASIFASIATTYTIRADAAMEADKATAAYLYKTASKYNRAFGVAALCRNTKTCEAAEDFWMREDGAK